MDKQDTARQFAVGILVNNHFGVLNRVAGLYAKRTYNIDSLAVGETEDPRFSRMTIVSTGDDYMREQVVKQLRKLHDVKEVVLFEDNSTVGVEHALVKMKSASEYSAGISDLVERFGGKIKDFGPDYVVIEITGDHGKVEAFLERVGRDAIIEAVRSGLISMSRDLGQVLSVAEYED
ncbi:MAG: acetolactate synthase small subunit [Coriobacteriia bacterium]|nr:acetolactate synthase small subunit [Coriobacteriia bacterium]